MEFDMNDKQTPPAPIKRIPRNLSKREMQQAMNRQLATLAESHNKLVAHVDELTRSFNSLVKQLQTHGGDATDNGDIAENNAT